MRDAAHWDFGRGCCTKHPGQSVPCQKCIEAGDFFDDEVINLQPISKERENAYKAVLGDERAVKVDFDEFARKLGESGVFGKSAAFAEQLQREFTNPDLEQSLFGNMVEQGRMAGDKVLPGQSQDPIAKSPLQVAETYGALDPYLRASESGSPPQQSKWGAAPSYGFKRFLDGGATSPEQETALWKQFIALGPPEVAYHAPDGRTPEQHEVLMQQMLTDKRKRIVEMAKEMKFLFPEASCGKSGDASSSEPSSEPSPSSD